ncbi:MAG: WD40/YVTN/BNR-like repeat-containing protein [Pseudohongiellaceae bacterium]
MKTLTCRLTMLYLLLSTAASYGQNFDGMEYRNVGPVRGGRVTAVAGTVAAPSTFYLGASGGGIWKTEDYGTSWNNVSDGYFATPSIGDIAVAQNDANIIYVGTGSDGLRSNVIAGKGVYKSIDGGDTWQHIGLDDTGHIGAVEINPSNHNIVYVAAIGQAFNSNDERGLYKTLDGGRNWEQVLFISDEIGISDVEMLPGNPEILFATAWKAERKPWTIISGGENDEGGLYKSVDGGANWEKITAGLPTGLIGKMDLAVTPANSSMVYLLVEAPGKEGGLYKSIDQGQTFEQVSDNPALITRPFYYTNIDVDPQNPDKVYSMATGNYVSNDGGVSWDRLATPHGDNHDMWINPNNPDLYIQANDGGANVTHNGGQTWSTQFNQPTAELYQVEVDDQYPYWLYAGMQDNGTTLAVPSVAPFGAQHSNRWIVDSGGCETGPALPKPGNHNIVYANCKGRFGVYDKRLGTEKGYYVGASNMYGRNPADLRYRFQRVSPIHVSPHDPSVIYHTSQYVHRTTDEGLTWETISPDLTAFEPERQVISGAPITRDITGEEFYSTIYSIRESTVQAGVIWVGSNDGPVHVTRDNGASWQDVTPRRLPSGGRVDAVEPSPHDPAKAYIAVLRYQFGDWKPYIYRTDNFGRNWDLLTNGNGIPEDYPTRVVREDPNKEGVLYAGTEYGIFVSLDDGDTWHDFQQNLPVTPVTDIKVFRGDLAISTMGRSFWVLDNITTLQQDAIKALDSEPVLFDPKTTIRYRRPRGMPNTDMLDYPQPAVVIDYYLPEDFDGRLTMEILDASGSVVNRFSNEDDASSEEPAEQAITDMGTNQTVFLVDDSLASDSGLNRFRWTMRHFGAWHENEERRYQNGPIVKPGAYTVRLSAGDNIMEQSFDLRVDPRVLEGGTSLADISEQVEMELEIVSLLSRARLMEDNLSKEKEELEEQDNGSLSEQQQERLDQVDAVLGQLQTAEGIYMPPMLTAQISYLYNMISAADQAPGQEAEMRLAELRQQFETLMEESAAAAD